MVSSTVCLIKQDFFIRLKILGANRLSKNIFLLTGEKPKMIFMFSWKFVSPLFILVIMSLNWYRHKSVTYENYVFPIGAQIFGWCIAITSIAAIPIAAIHSFLNASGDGFVQVSYLRD